MNGRAAEVAAVAALVTVLTIVLAAPVMRAPSERMFGMAIVGRHYDPFTVMEQFNQPIRWTAFWQPVTDVPGALLARLVGTVAAYNAIVLLSFPLVAVAAFLLARHCGLSPIGAGGAALAVAYSPFHLAQAAYHPHVAQLQWLPVYLLVLWRCLDAPTWNRGVALLLAIAGVTLSNFYGGLIGMVMTPMAVASYWFFEMRREVAANRRLLLTSSVLVVVAMLGVVYAFSVAGDLLLQSSTVDFPRSDLTKYSARWWSYWSPPWAHPLWGASRWTPNAVDPQRLEQQVSLGWSLTGLSVLAVIAWVRQRTTSRMLSSVPVLAVVAGFAWLFSISPTTMLYSILPMFRSYARFGSVVQLMVALLAAIGAEQLWRSGARGARGAVVALVVVAAAEYAVWPPMLWRDVLPTAAHRWAVRRPAFVHVLDCYPYTQESASVPWLTTGRVILRPRSIGDCREPGVIATLSAAGFTHLLIRRDSPEGGWLEGQTPPRGLVRAARFDDAEVFAVTDRSSLIRTMETHDFYPVEFDDEWSWRWMGTQASWAVRNTSVRALLASVDLETHAFHEPKRMTIVLDGEVVQDVLIDSRRTRRRIGPLAIWPGDHTLTFRAASPPAVADDVIHNGDRRPLSVAFGDWRWSVAGDPP